MSHCQNERCRVFSYKWTQDKGLNVKSKKMCQYYSEETRRKNKIHLNSKSNIKANFWKEVTYAFPEIATEEKNPYSMRFSKPCIFWNKSIKINMKFRSAWFFCESVLVGNRVKFYSEYHFFITCMILTNETWKKKHTPKTSNGGSDDALQKNWRAWLPAGKRTQEGSLGVFFSTYWTLLTIQARYWHDKCWRRVAQC